MSPLAVAAFQKLIAEALDGMLDNGFELPFRGAAIGVNGSCHVFEWVQNDRGGLEMEMLTSFDRDGGLAIPINIMFVDARGRAARVLFGPDAEAKAEATS